MSRVLLLLCICQACCCGTISDDMKAAAFDLGPTAPIFEDIYDSKAWATDEHQSASGPGSEPTAGAVNETVDFVLDLVASNFLSGVTPQPIVLADAGCGDLRWVGRLLAELSRMGLSVRYDGYDIVDITARGGLIQLHKSLETIPKPSRPVVRVSQLDVTRSTLPVTANLVLVKDVINHIQLQPARTALCLLVEAIAAGGLVVVTNNQNSRMNGEIEMDVVGYESRPRNLQLAPFAFPAPVKSTEYLSAWWAEDLRTGPCSQPSVPAKHHPEL